MMFAVLSCIVVALSFTLVDARLLHPSSSLRTPVHSGSSSVLSAAGRAAHGIAIEDAQSHGSEHEHDESPQSGEMDQAMAMIEMLDRSRTSSPLLHEVRASVAAAATLQSKSSSSSSSASSSASTSGAADVDDLMTRVEGVASAADIRAHLEPYLHPTASSSLSPKTERMESVKSHSQRRERRLRTQHMKHILEMKYAKQHSASNGLKHAAHADVASSSTSTSSSASVSRGASVVSNHTVVRSLEDLRLYRFLTLANGLRVVLVSDANTTKSAASMDVGNGYLSDPVNIPGLAHFLEHMLFLGTSKYRSESEYADFIEAHGGFSNAYTSMENTNYYFDILPQHLSGALDRFAQFFVSPTLSVGTTQREMNAVDSEHSKNILQDNWRTNRLFQVLAQPGHVYSKFGTGCSKTLDAMPHAQMRGHLRKFWWQHYAAGNLVLSVIGAEPLDELQVMVEVIFGEIRVAGGVDLDVEGPKPAADAAVEPAAEVATETAAVSMLQKSDKASDKASTEKGEDDEDSEEDEHDSEHESPSSSSSTPANFNPLAGTTYKSVFNSSILPGAVWLTTIEDSRFLSLTFPVPSQHEFYSTQALGYIRALLESRSPGSLLHELKGKGWATAINLGVDASTSAFATVQFQVDLTARGALCTDDIVLAFFAYLELIGAEAKDSLGKPVGGVTAWRYAEIAAIAKLNFDYKDKEQPSDYISKLASNSRHYPPADLLVGGHLFLRYSARRICHLLAALKPQNMLLVLGGKNLDHPMRFKEAWYGLEYDWTPISAERMDFFRGNAAGAPTSVLENLSIARQSSPLAYARSVEGGSWNLALPVRNIYIPKDKLVVAPALDPSVPLPIIIFETSGSNITDSRSVAEALSSKFPQAEANAPSNTGAVRLWFSEDLDFHRPHAHTIIRFYIPHLYSSPRSYLLTNIYINLLEDFLDETLYPALLAGFSSHLRVGTCYIDLVFHGYNSGLAAYGLALAKLVASFVPNEGRFAVYKESLLQSFYNKKYELPHKQASALFANAMDSKLLPNFDLASALRGLAFQEILSWPSILYADMSIEALVHGNISPLEAKSLLREFVGAMPPFTSSSASFARSPSRNHLTSRPRLVQLREQFELTLLAPNPLESNAAIYHYWQYGMGGMEGKLYSQLLALIAQKPIFHQLRTQEQLGYIVWSSADQRLDVNGFKVQIQSGKRNGTYLAGRIELFVRDTLQPMLQALSQSQFEMYVETLMQSKMQSPISLAVQTSWYWSEISRQEFVFQRREIELYLLNATKIVSREGFNKFVSKMFWISDIKNEPKESCELRGGGSISVRVESPLQLAAQKVLDLANAKAGAAGDAAIAKAEQVVAKLSESQSVHSHPTKKAKVKGAKKTKGSASAALDTSRVKVEKASTAATTPAVTVAATTPVAAAAAPLVVAANSAPSVASVTPSSAPLALASSSSSSTPLVLALSSLSAATTATDADAVAISALQARRAALVDGLAARVAARDALHGRLNAESSGKKDASFLELAAEQDHPHHHHDEAPAAAAAPQISYDDALHMIDMMRSALSSSPHAHGKASEHGHAHSAKEGQASSAVLLAPTAGGGGLFTSTTVGSPSSAAANSASLASLFLLDSPVILRARSRNGRKAKTVLSMTSVKTFSDNQMLYPRNKFERPPIVTEYVPHDTEPAVNGQEEEEEDDEEGEEGEAHSETE